MGRAGESGRTERLDRLLVARGLAPTRARAQALILAGRVHSEGRTTDKPGTRFPLDAAIEIKPAPHYVSRGGLKLAPVLAEFGIDVSGRDALDVGASTGGFTQVLLESGARRVFAVDVGRGQLDWGLRRDDRVTVLDGRNARYLAPEDLPCRPSLAVIDVSFISVTLVLPAVASCLADGAEIVALVKPQFEAGRRAVGKGGIVRDPAVHADALRRVASLAAARGWGLRGVSTSAIRGAEGNVEFFVHLVPSGPGLDPAAVERAIEVATAADKEASR